MFPTRPTSPRRDRSRDLARSQPTVIKRTRQTASTVREREALARDTAVWAPVSSEVYPIRPIRLDIDYRPWSYRRGGRGTKAGDVGRLQY